LQRKYRRGIAYVAVGDVGLDGEQIHRVRLHDFVMAGRTPAMT
jgi:hypothetical protein